MATFTDKIKAKRVKENVEPFKEAALKSSDFQSFAKSKGANVTEGGQIASQKGGRSALIGEFLGGAAGKQIKKDQAVKNFAATGQARAKAQGKTQLNRSPEARDQARADQGAATPDSATQANDAVTNNNGGGGKTDPNIIQFNKNFEIMQQQRTEDKAKQTALGNKGIGPQNTSTPDISSLLNQTTQSGQQGAQSFQEGTGIQESGQSGLPELPQNLTGAASNVFGAQQLIAQQGALTSTNLANDNFSAQERGRRNQLISSLTDTSIGQAAKAAGGTLADLTTAQLEEFAASEGIELSDKIRERLQSEGKSLIETQKINRNANQAVNDYSRNQLERNFGRAITDREKFNTQQDVKLRRLSASFGGGQISSLGANVAVMEAGEAGQRALEDIRGTYIDNVSLLSSQAKQVNDTYANNVSMIESKMAGILEDKLAAITTTVDELLDAGITNKETLNNAVATAKLAYMKSYSEISGKALEFMQKANQQLFENKNKLKDLQLGIDKSNETSFFESIIGGGINGSGVSSSQTSNTENMVEVSGGNSNTSSTENIVETSGGDGSTFDSSNLNSSNCVLWARDRVTNLPFGLFTKEDKMRAITEEGSTDKSQIKPGDAILTSEGEYGHVAIVKSVDGDTLVLDEANYRSGKVTSGRTIGRYDDKIYGSVSPTIGPPMSIGGNMDLEGTNDGVESQVLGASETNAEQTNEAEPIAGPLSQDQLDDVVFAFDKSSETEQNQILKGAADIGALSQLKEALQGGPVPGLTPFQVTQAISFATKEFGKIAARQPETIEPIYEMLREGLSIDQIDDRLRFGAQSELLTGVHRDAVESLTRTLLSHVAENTRQTYERSLEEGNMERIKTLVKEVAFANNFEATQTALVNKDRTVEVLNEIKGDLKRYEELNGDTNIFKGTNEKVLNKIGNTLGEGELATIATKIQAAIQSYRKAITGAAFNELEGEEYNNIFPSISKTGKLNSATIKGLLDIFEGDVKHAITLRIGKAPYDEIFGESQTATPGQVNTGFSPQELDGFRTQLDSGQILIMLRSGEIQGINSQEFDEAIHTKI